MTINILEKIKENEHYEIKQDMHHYCMFCNERRLKKLDSMKLHTIKYHSDKIDLSDTKKSEVFSKTFEYCNNISSVLSNPMMKSLINTSSFKSELLKNFINDLNVIGIDLNFNLNPAQIDNNKQEKTKTENQKTLKIK